MEIKRNFYINLYLKDSLGIKFTACLLELMPETSFATCDSYRYFVGQA